MCPHCGYQEYDSELNLGEHGYLYVLTNDILATRYLPTSWKDDVVRVYACPKCKKLFIGDKQV